MLISLPMRRGASPRGVAWRGTVVGTLGLVGEALRDMTGPASLLHGLLLPAWFAAVGWRLSRLARA